MNAKFHPIFTKRTTNAPIDVLFFWETIGWSISFFLSSVYYKNIVPTVYFIYGIEQILYFSLFATNQWVWVCLQLSVTSSELSSVFVYPCFYHVYFVDSLIWMLSIWMKNNVWITTHCIYRKLWVCCVYLWVTVYICECL